MKNLKKRLFISLVSSPSKNIYTMGDDMYEISDEEFKDRLIKRKFKNGKITKEKAFLELI